MITEWADDWGALGKPIERISAYTFRGDGRDPATIKAANGFSPPSTRTDDYYLDNEIIPNFVEYMSQRFDVMVDPEEAKRYAKGNGGTHFVQYEMWRKLLKNEELHLGRMLANEFLKGYISTSKSTLVARKFGTSFNSRDAWVYLMYVQGAFLVPHRGQHDWVKYFEEHEVAQPGAAPWNNVVGYRRVLADGSWDGPIYLRSTFVAQEKESALTALNLFRI